MEHYDAREFDLAGRIGRLKTRSGIIETPYLFPVVDPTKQEVSLSEISEVGFNAFITNAYLLYRRLNGSTVDIHGFLNWNKPIMTDSGGYQILEYRAIEVDDATILEYQKRIGSDICVILDVPTGADSTYEQAYSYVQETIRRAWTALPKIMDSNQLWVYPIQGAPYVDLIEYSSLIAKRLPYHVYSLGSPTVFLERYSYENIVEYVAVAKNKVPAEKPFHVFGVGHPMVIPFLVALGVDTFDSASYVLYARDERLMFDFGSRSLKELHYLPCYCPVCSKTSVEELRSMPRKERVKLIAKHNLYTLMGEIRRVKQVVKEGRLWEYLEYRSKAHPSLRRAFSVLKKHIDYLIKFSSSPKTSAVALMLIDADSTANPKLTIAIDSTFNFTLKGGLGKVVLIPALSKPFDKQDFVGKILEKHRDYRAVFYHPYLGLFPLELANTYPYFQHEVGLLELSEEAVRRITGLLIEAKPVEVIILYPDDPVFSTLAERIHGALVKAGVKTSIRGLNSLV